MAGAINAITRPGEGPPAADFFASGGAAGYYQLGASVRGESGPVGYAFTADRRKVDNVYNRDTRTVPRVADDGSLQQQEVPLRNVGYEDVRMMGRLDFSVSDAWDMTLLPRISRYETGLDMSSRLPAAVEEHKRDTAVNLGGIFRYNGTGALAAQIRTSYRYSNQRLFQENFTLAPTRQTTIVDPPGPAVSESVSHGVFPFAALTGQDTGFRSVLVEPQLTWAPNLDHTVVLGASYTGERGSFGDSIIADRSNLLGSEETLARVAAGIQAGMAAGGVPNPTVTLVRNPAIGEAFSLSQGRREQFDIFSAYVQDEWVLADRLRLVPGLRYDQHSEFGSVGSPKVSLLYALTPTTRVRTSAGRAFRAPSLFELFGNVVFHGPIPGLPNPDLEPEHIASFDGGIQHEVSRALRTEMNVFHNDMTDLIQLVISPQRDHFDWVNVADARSTGLELVANGPAASWLGYYANYAYTDSEDRATGNPLALVPRHKVNAGVQLGAALGSWRLTGSVDQRWVGERTQSSQGVPVLLDEYVRHRPRGVPAPEQRPARGRSRAERDGRRLPGDRGEPDARPSRLGERGHNAVLEGEPDDCQDRTDTSTDGTDAAGRPVVPSQADRGGGARGGGALERLRRLPAPSRGDPGGLRQLPGIPARAHRTRAPERGGARRAAGHGGAGPRRRLAVYVFGRGLQLDESQLGHLREAGRRGARLFVQGATNPAPDVTNLRGTQLDAVNGYLEFGGAENYARLLNFSRVELDGKSFRSDPVQPPVERSMDVLFHLDDDLTFGTVDAFDALLRRAGAREAGRPEDRPDHERARPLQRQPGPRRRVHRRARRPEWNVYPLASAEKRLDFLRRIDPDLVVLMPHGRLTLGRADEAIAWLRERNIPMLTPVSVFQNHDDWVTDQQGMAGSMLTMSVVLPELDAGWRPTRWRRSSPTRTATRSSTRYRSGSTPFATSSSAGWR